MDLVKDSPDFMQPSLNRNSKNHTIIDNIISPEYNRKEFRKKFKNSWRIKGESLIGDNSENKGLKVINTPFNCAFIPNIIEDNNLLQEVIKELETLNFQNKNNDLFKFKCSEDLININEPNIQKLCHFIKTPLKQWMQKLTGLPLNDKVAISCSKYDFSDILLCHDDELEGRRIAFIIYLTPKWEKKYGGSLDLFSVDEQNRPLSIVERFYPRFNSLAFFEVTPVSFHQVAEVLVKDKTRLSINGWFHGEPIIYPSRPILRSSTFIIPDEVEERVVYSWINPMYLDQNTQMEIRKVFLHKSEIQLPDFLKQRKYKCLAEELNQSVLKWSWTGPPNKRHLEVLKTNDLPEVVREFLTLMQSEAMFLILSQLTGLTLHHLAPPDEDEESEEEASESSDDSRETSVGHSSKIFGDKPQTSGRNTFAIKCDAATSSGRCSDPKRGQKRKRGSAVDGVESEALDHLGPAIGGLIDGWESDVEGEDFRETAATRNREENTKGEVSSEIRRWRWGAYSLMRDDDLRRDEEFILDTSLFCNASKDWEAEFGGGTFYVAKGEETELLTILPSSNSLALVYRDRDTFRFTKHINANSQQLGEGNFIFQEIFCEYRETH